MPEEGLANEGSLFEDITVDPVSRGFIRDWDAMEDLLHHVLYSGLGWEIGNEGQILFTDPLCTPKVVIVTFRKASASLLLLLFCAFV